MNDVKEIIDYYPEFTDIFTDALKDYPNGDGMRLLLRRVVKVIRWAFGELGKMGVKATRSAFDAVDFTEAWARRETDLVNLGNIEFAVVRDLISARGACLTTMTCILTCEKDVLNLIEDLMVVLRRSNGVCNGEVALSKEEMVKKLFEIVKSDIPFLLTQANCQAPIINWIRKSLEVFLGDI